MPPRKPQVKSDLPSSIVPVGSGSGNSIRLLVYGQPGTGKTVLAGTSPNCLILECDRGDESAKARGSDAHKWTIDDWNDMQEAYDYLRNGGHKDFDWVWIDSLTLFQERGLDNIMEDLVAEKPHRKVWAPDKGEYGQNMSRLTRLLRDFVNLPLNIGVTAHVIRTEDYTDGEVTYMPYVQGKNMPDKVCSYFGVVAHLTTVTKEGEEQVKFSTLKSNKWYAKDRYGTIGAMLDPSVPKILTRIEQAGSKGSARRRQETKDES